MTMRPELLVDCNDSPSFERNALALAARLDEVAAALHTLGAATRLRRLVVRGAAGSVGAAVASATALSRLRALPADSSDNDDDDGQNNGAPRLAPLFEAIGAACGPGGTCSASGAKNGGNGGGQLRELVLEGGALCTRRDTAALAALLNAATAATPTMLQYLEVAAPVFEATTFFDGVRRARTLRTLCIRGELRYPVSSSSAADGDNDGGGAFAAFVESFPALRALRLDGAHLYPAELQSLLTALERGGERAVLRELRVVNNGQRGLATPGIYVTLASLLRSRHCKLAVLDLTGSATLRAMRRGELPGHVVVGALSYVNTTLEWLRHDGVFEYGVDVELDVLCYENRTINALVAASPPLRVPPAEYQQQQQRCSFNCMPDDVLLCIAERVRAPRDVAALAASCVVGRWVAFSSRILSRRNPSPPLFDEDADDVGALRAALFKRVAAEARRDRLAAAFRMQSSSRRK